MQVWTLTCASRYNTVAETFHGKVKYSAATFVCTAPNAYACGGESVGAPAEFCLQLSISWKGGESNTTHPPPSDPPPLGPPPPLK